MGPPVINLLIDLDPARGYGGATVDALTHAAAAAGSKVEVRVVPTATIGSRLAGGDVPGCTGDGVVVGPGSPYRDPDAVLAVIRVARERGVPLVGT